MKQLIPSSGQREIFLAGGCFWGTQEYLRRLPGVAATQVGYANGLTPGPVCYEQVCSGITGHAEAVQVIYDPEILPLAFLLDQFYTTIDPCAINRQGNDMGVQYRTGIYYTNSRDETTAKASLKALQARTQGAVAVECGPLENYCPAEEYHQDYLLKNPGGYCHISPDKLAEATGVRAPSQQFSSNTTPSSQASLKAAEQAPYTVPDKGQLRQRLTPLQYAVTQQNATEPPFHNLYWNEHRPGIYVDVTTGQPLFSARDKFDSGCGWPSFSRPIADELLQEVVDVSHGMVRTEVRSVLGKAHLGHVFPDGPAQRGGLRYCINSASLRFVPLEQMEQEGYGQYLSIVQ